MVFFLSISDEVVARIVLFLVDHWDFCQLLWLCLIVLHSGFDNPKKKLPHTRLIPFIVSNHSMILENFHEHFRHEPTRKKTYHEEDVSRRKFSQVPLQCGRRVSKREGVALNCHVGSTQVLPIIVQCLEILRRCW